MAITAINLTFGEVTVAATAATTASITPAANKLIILSVSGGTTTRIPTASGDGLTFVQIASTGDATNGTHVVTMFRAMVASPTSGAITIDFAGISQNRISWSVEQFTGMDTTGTNGSGAIGQSVTGNSNNVTSTGVTLTLAALASAASAAYGFIFNTALPTIVKGASFTELANNNGDGELETQWAINQTSVPWMWASGTGFNDSIAIEIKANIVSLQTYVSSPYSLLPDPAW